MNTKSIIIVGLCLLVISLVFWSFAPNKISESKRTEEYAHVDVRLHGRQQTIRLSKGLENTTSYEVINDRTSSLSDLTPALSILNKLNGEGFEIVNSTLAYEPLGGGDNNFGEVRYSFIMVKKIK